MAHAEKYPICLGDGKKRNEYGLPIDESCHSCVGRGWIEVSDDEQAQGYYPPMDVDETSLGSGCNVSKW